MSQDRTVVLLMTAGTPRGAGLRVLVLNLAMDAAHPSLGHVPVWTNELASRCAHLSVITMLVGEIAPAENVTVHSLGKELGRSEPRRFVEFYRVLGRVLREGPIDVCFAHMAPLFASMFAPVGAVRRIPTLLWYSHGGATRRLRLAHRLTARSVTTNPAGFPIPSDKLHVIGHGVDTEVFTPPAEPREGYDHRLLQVGRVSRIKRVDETLRALAILVGEGRRDLTLSVMGGGQTEADRGYESELRDLCRSLGMDRRVSFEGSVPFQEMPERYHRGAVLVNLMETSLDKTILEGMASGCIPVSTNAGFREIAAEQELEQLVPDAGAEGLARAIAGVLDLSARERAEISARLRQVVEQEHSLSALIDRIVDHLTELARR